MVTPRTSLLAVALNLRTIGYFDREVTRAPESSRSALIRPRVTRQGMGKIASLVCTNSAWSGSHCY
jgi:hypothetical protein